MAKTRKRLGELVLRSADPQALVTFYRDIIGLEPFATVGSATFLKVADDFAGHPQLLAIFQMSHTFSGPKDLQPALADASAGSLHHFAFAMEKADFEAEQGRLMALGVPIQLADHPRFGWRSIYLFDPDGNSVELVCFDAGVLESSGD
ncbi:hypothetical protein JCM30471_29440 [Desulfuromonas carbonis]|uniref:VOC family protein n=1 Tax=Desulfuromonas sp. DDH964 TaxID=1823759 RepID=UPI00078EEA7C|nr:VOC family protein [Desulfuromonas sp. DDH964]AMV71122.1 hypothetical protein DBW_0737 [Desulfuromonas sp. DDH964]